MNYVRLSLLSLTTLVGCVSVRDYRPRADQSGLFRAERPKIEYRADPEEVLRTPDRRLVTSAEEAQRVLNEMRKLSDLNDNSRANKCSVKRLYGAKVEQYRAQAAIHARDYAGALDALNAAERACPDLYLITAQEYLKAVVFNGLGRHAEAKAAAARFLDYAAAITPARFRQFEGPQLADIVREFEADGPRLITYRARARDYLAGRAALIWDEPVAVAKFYANAVFRPGGNRFGGWFAFPVLGYGENYGTAYGLIGYYSFGRRSVTASTIATTSSGAYHDVRFRESVYESPNRHFDADVFLGGRTLKLLKITERNDVFTSPQRDVHVERTSFDPYLGTGATYRFRPGVGLSAQLTTTLNQFKNRVDFGHSLYAFYDLLEEISLNAGWISSRPMVSISLTFMHLGYNFRDQEVQVLLQNLQF